MQTPQAPATLGPQRTSGPWNTCFAHSPSGALLAAMNLWAEGTAADPSAVFAHLAVGAPADLGNGDRLDAAARCSSRATATSPMTPTTARILVVIRGPQGKLGRRGDHDAVGRRRLEVRVPGGRGPVDRR